MESPKTIAALTLALKHAEQAHRNLSLVQVWASRKNQRHLEQGMQDLIGRMARLAADVRTLIAVLRAQTLDVTGETRCP